MARISTLAPRITAPRPKLQAPKDEAGRGAYRDRNEPWRAWYKTSRWQRLRWYVLTAAQFVCAMCHRLEGKSSELVADHITPHKGDEALFWDQANIQCLCRACHDGTKKRMERSGRV